RRPAPCGCRRPATASPARCAAAATAAPPAGGWSASSQAAGPAQLRLSGSLRCCSSCPLLGSLPVVPAACASGREFLSVGLHSRVGAGRPIVTKFIDNTRFVSFVTLHLAGREITEKQGKIGLR